MRARAYAYAAWIEGDESGYLPTVEKQFEEIKTYAIDHHIEIIEEISEVIEQTTPPIAKRKSLRRFFSSKNDEILLVYNTLLVGRNPKEISEEISACITFKDMRFIVELREIKLRGFNSLLAMMYVYSGRSKIGYQQHTKDRLRAEGKYLGGRRPFGWDVDESLNLVENPSEQEIIRLMLTMRSNGKSLRAVSDALKKRGFDISHQGVQKILAANEKLSNVS
ncbi:hypothetical protein U0C82_16735 [Fulvimarina sp. 2208YS6-2-32]|uniref:Recombinase domain-containing protein n=1 Tax=Fulvimarina uroteuthidis TaxID=3098149 RepID=A0ABU5I5Y4_9HYPH|nr:hypothetical protein [Fulvimarina sp. 2208YS6-2-32]MDY8110789.1 hypothetical protein [Fulvimarina sp. 2208YS6-2-32]